jgi:hypothetical protein
MVIIVLSYITTEAEPDVGFGGPIEEGGFAGVDRLEKLCGVTLFLEVDQVLIVAEDSHVRERPPSSLDFLNC